MMIRFRASNPISFNISSFLHRHVDSPSIFRLLSSSSYNKASNDRYSSDRPPPPRRRSASGGGGSSERGPSSSRLSGFIDGAGDNRGREYGGRRRDFDNNRKPNYHDDDDDNARASKRVSMEINKADSRKSEVGSSYIPFSDDDQKPQFSPKRTVKDDKLLGGDGFLERFKLGVDQEKNKPAFNNLDGSRGGGDGESVAEQTAPLPPEDADEIFRKMKETGLIPNAVAMLHGLCSDGLVQDAMKLFGLMRERGTIPEVVVYTAVVEGFCKAQKLDDAKRIFRKMQSNGVVANAFSYGVVVQGLCKGKRLDDALEFCLEMVEAGHSPNLATFVGLVDGFCRDRGLEAASIMIGNLREKGFCFDEKAVREFLDKKGPFMPLVWEAIVGKKSSQLF